MNATAMDRAADRLYDLDLLASQELVVQVERTIVPYPLTPTAWLERSCPMCLEQFEIELDICPEDGEPLREVLVSRPFLWLG